MSDQLRVLSVIGNLNVGGTESYLSRIAPAIREHGVDMEICALEPVGPLLRGLTEQGIVVHGTPYGERTARSNTMTLLRTVGAIRRIVRSGWFDVVNTYLFWSDVLGVAAARLAGARRIDAGYGCWSLSPDGKRLAAAVGTSVTLIDPVTARKRQIGRLPPRDVSAGWPEPAVAWSPDGSEIAVVLAIGDASRVSYRLLVVCVRDGRTRTLLVLPKST